jgi:hypothetical protein
LLATGPSVPLPLPPEPLPLEPPSEPAGTAPLLHAVAAATARRIKFR